MTTTTKHVWQPLLLLTAELITCSADIIIRFMARRWRSTCNSWSSFGSNHIRASPVPLRYRGWLQKPAVYRAERVLVMSQGTATLTILPFTPWPELVFHQMTWRHNSLAGLKKHCAGRHCRRYSCCILSASHIYHLQVVQLRLPLWQMNRNTLCWQRLTCLYLLNSKRSSPSARRLPTFNVT